MRIVVDVAEGTVSIQRAISSSDVDGDARATATSIFVSDNGASIIVTGQNGL
jgi:hypothetical protein